MLAITLFLLAAPPTAVEHPVRHARRPVAVRVHHGRRPISLTAGKMRADDCQAGAICVDGVDAQMRYRLPLVPDAEPDAKTRAIAETGTRCALIGQTVCPGRTRMILKAGEDPVETISTSFAPK
jgi:hypothetical protein